LGARLFVSVNPVLKPGDLDATQLEELVTTEGRLQNRTLLLKRVKQGQVTVGIRQGITQGDSALENYVKVVEGFTATNRAEVPVISRKK
jgi:hypothetical protein